MHHPWNHVPSCEHSTNLRPEAVINLLESGLRTNSMRPRDSAAVSVTSLSSVAVVLVNKALPSSPMREHSMTTGERSSKWYLLGRSGLRRDCIRAASAAAERSRLGVEEALVEENDASGEEACTSPDIDGAALGDDEIYGTKSVGIGVTGNPIQLHIGKYSVSSKVLYRYPLILISSCPPPFFSTVQYAKIDS